jgi:branched-chain amino acid transport system permease protein
VYALIALGYTMVYGVLRLINFAHGDVYMMGAFFAYYTALKLGVKAATLPGQLTVMAAAMVGCAVLGVVIERLAYKPVRKAPRLTALITAIGVSLLLENGGQIVFGPNTQPFPEIVPVRQVARLGSITVTNQQVLILVSCLGLMLLLQFFVHRTKMGKAMRAVSYDRDAASLMGINTDSVISVTFAIGSALAGAAGVLLAIYDPTIDPLMGLLPGLKAFAAAVLGGIGSIPGAMFGGLFLGMAETLVAGSKLFSSYRDAIAFAVLVIVLLVKPTGIFGTGAVEKV